MAKELSKLRTIKFHLEQSEAGQQSALEHGWLCGKLLRAEKRKLKHGKFTEWLKDEENWPRSERLAQEYMQINEHLTESQVLGMSSITEARKHLPKKPRKANPKAQSRAVLEGELQTDQHVVQPSKPAPPSENGSLSSVHDWKKDRDAIVITAQQHATLWGGKMQRMVDDLNDAHPYSPKTRNTAISCCQQVLQVLKQIEKLMKEIT